MSWPSWLAGYARSVTKFVNHSRRHVTAGDGVAAAGLGASSSAAVRRCRTSASRMGSWPFTSLDRASASVVHSARSISGKLLMVPEPFGHSSAKGVAHDVFGLKGRFGGEDGDDLAGGLPEVAERVVLGGRCRSADLLRELTMRGRQRVLAGGVFALGDGPGVRLLAGPERSAHVGDPDLERGVPVARPAGRRPPQLYSRMPALRTVMAPPHRRDPLVRSCWSRAEDVAEARERPHVFCYVLGADRAEDGPVVGTAGSGPPDLRDVTAAVLTVRNPGQMGPVQATSQWPCVYEIPGPVKAHGRRAQCLGKVAGPAVVAQQHTTAGQ